MLRVRMLQSMPIHLVFMSAEAPQFSFVVPLHNTGDLLRPLLGAFRAEAMTLRDSWELVLVDAGSSDGTLDAARRLIVDFPAPVTLVELARNYGEHAAVLEGWRRSSGRFVVNLDDDLQNPVSEARRLLEHLRERMWPTRSTSTKCTLGGGMPAAGWPTPVPPS